MNKFYILIVLSLCLGSIIKNQMAHGEGSLNYPPRGCIIGNCDNGEGTFIYLNGHQYSGEFRDGIKHGYGIYLMPSYSEVTTKNNLIIEQYEGEWEDGKFHGQGTFTFSDGNKGVGSFRGNKPWNITIYDKDGKISWKMVKGVRVEK